MARPLSVLTLCVGLTLTLSAAEAQGLSPAGQRALRNIESTMRNVREDPRLFDGKQIRPGARMDQMQNYLQRTKSNLNRAIGTLNRMSPRDRAVPAVQAQARRMQQMTDYVNAMSAAASSMGQSGQQADDKCRAFEKEIMRQGKAMHTMAPFINALVNPEVLAFGRPENVAEVADLLKQVKAACRSPRFVGVGKVGCRWMKVGGRGRDPSAWCEVAARSKELIRAGVKGYIRTTTRASMASIMSPEKLEKVDGWLRFEDPVSHKTHLHFGGPAKARLMKRYQPMLEAAGMDPEAETDLFATQVAALDALRAAVDRLAPTWKTRDRHRCNYACNLAKAQIRRWYKEGLGVNAAVKQVFLTRKTWNIRKNRLGVPIERTQGGQVILQVPGDPWLQARSFVVTEAYKGGGRYQQAKGVKFGYVRFQKRP